MATMATFACCGSMVGVLRTATERQTESSIVGVDQEHRMRKNCWTGDDRDEVEQYSAGFIATLRFFLTSKINYFIISSKEADNTIAVFHGDEKSRIP